MEHYLNLNGSSGIAAYEISTYAITVFFKDNSVYEYTYTSAGIAHIEKAKSLARRVHGLNTFINQSMKFQYSRSVR